MSPGQNVTYVPGPYRYGTPTVKEGSMVTLSLRHASSVLS
jgi:hypothetical protein